MTAKRYGYEVADGAKAIIGNANEFHGRHLFGFIAGKRSVEFRFLKVACRYRQWTTYCVAKLAFSLRQTKATKIYLPKRAIFNDRRLGKGRVTPKNHQKIQEPSFSQ